MTRASGLCSDLEMLNEELVHQSLLFLVSSRSAGNALKATRKGTIPRISHLEKSTLGSGGFIYYKFFLFHPHHLGGGGWGVGGRPTCMDYMW